MFVRTTSWLQKNYVLFQRAPTPRNRATNVRVLPWSVDVNELCGGGVANEAVKRGRRELLNVPGVEVGKRSSESPTFPEDMQHALIERALQNCRNNEGLLRLGRELLVEAF